MEKRYVDGVNIDKGFDIINQRSSSCVVTLCSNINRIQQNMFLLESNFYV